MGTPPIYDEQRERCTPYLLLLLILLLLTCRAPQHCGVFQFSLSEIHKTPPLCGANHIGEVARSDGGVKKISTTEETYQGINLSLCRAP